MGKASKFGLGLALGALAGYAVSFLMSDQLKAKQKQTVTKWLDDLSKTLMDDQEKEKMAELLSQTREQAEEKLLLIRHTLNLNLESAKETLKDVDKDKYLKAVEKTIKDFKDEGQLNTKQLQSVQKYLVKDFERFSSIKKQLMQQK